MKKYINIIVPLTIGLICGIITYIQNSGPDKNVEPITISLNCSNAKDGIQCYYTTEPGEEFSDDNVVSSNGVTDEQHLEIPLEIKSLYKLKIGLGKAPGVVTLKNITITGNNTVQIKNFDNTEKNDIDEYFWNVDTVYVKSLEENPYIAFQTPFNIGAKPSSDNSKVYTKTAISFVLSALIVFLILFIAQLIAKKKGTDIKTMATDLGYSILSSLKSICAFIKTYAKEVAALTIGLACAIALYEHNSASKEELDPISVSFDCSSIQGGVKLYYTTEDDQEFSNNQMLSAINSEGHLEFLIGAKSLKKIRLDLGYIPGVFTLDNFTIKGDKTVKITNFNNTEQNQIDEVFWDGSKVAIKSLEANPYIIFQKPFNIKAKSNHIHVVITSLMVFFAISLIIYLILCVAIRLISKDGTSFKRAYVTSMVLLAGIISCVVAKSLSEKLGSYYQKQISISADVKGQVPFFITYYYTTTPEETFSDAKKVDVVMNAGENESTVQLPTSHLEKLRVDFGINPGVIEMKSLSIQGDKNIEVLGEDFNNSEKNDLEECSVTNNGIVIKSTASDPFIAFNKRFSIDGTKHINTDAVIFATILLLVLALFSFTIKLTSKNVEGKKSEDVILVITFLAICIVPTFFLTDKTVSESEKRTLAKFPVISDSTGFNSGFSTQFDSWYSDHFAKRDEIVGFNNIIFQSEGDVQNDNVMEGKDGWLFYKTDKCTENFTNITLINDQDLVLIKDYLTTINNWCNAHGKKFYFLICPNKSTIYGENIKHIKKLKGDEYSDAMRVINFLKGSEIKSVFSKDEVMKHKNDGYLLYFKQDTHHSEMGAYYSYKAIMELISKDVPVVITPLSSMKTSVYKEYGNGDLKKMMPGAIDDDTCSYQHFEIGNANMVGGGDVVSFSMTNSQASGRLYVLGDSFSASLQMLFATSFNTVNVNRVHQYWFPDEELDKIDTSSDIVILEVVERHLSLLAHQKVASKMQPYAPQAAVVK